MSIEPISAPKVVNEYIRSGMTELLRASDIYPLASYGWLDEDTADPDEVGHAMWQTDSLAFRRLDAVVAATYSGGKVPPPLEPWQQFLIERGGDFEGLMEAARLSIGLALYQREATDRDHYAADGFFQVHLLASMVILGAASDRLRDVFIAGVFQLDAERYGTGKWKENNRTAYATPFAEAAERFPSDHPARDSIAKLPALAAEAQRFRRERNKIVHDIATEIGRQERDLAMRRPPTGYEELDAATYDEFKALAERAEDQYRKRIADDVNRSIRWYRLLIDMSNHVFIVENTCRRRA